MWRLSYLGRLRISKILRLGRRGTVVWQPRARIRLQEYAADEPEWRQMPAKFPTAGECEQPANRAAFGHFAMGHATGLCKSLFANAPFQVFSGSSRNGSNSGQSVGRSELSAPQRWSFSWTMIRRQGVGGQGRGQKAANRTEDLWLIIGLVNWEDGIGNRTRRLLEQQLLNQSNRGNPIPLLCS
jgi:hypothetical protein